MRVGRTCTDVRIGTAGDSIPTAIARLRGRCARSAFRARLNLFRAMSVPSHSIIRGWSQRAAFSHVGGLLGGWASAYSTAVRLGVTGVGRRLLAHVLRH